MRNILYIFIFIFLPVLAYSQPLDMAKEISNVGVVGGGSMIFKSNQFAPAVFIEYEYYNIRHLGFGVSGRVIMAEFMEYGVGFPVILHPKDKIRFWLTPGLLYSASLPYSNLTAFEDPEGNPLPPVPAEESPLTGNFFFGAGFSYEIMLTENFPGFSILPYMNLDLVALEVPYFTIGMKLELQLMMSQKDKKQLR